MNPQTWKHAGDFIPSAHAAAALAVSLVLLHHVPLAGVVFLIIALWIAVAAVVGGHHYAIDVVLGAAIALAVDMAWRANLIPSTVFTAPRHRFACSALNSTILRGRGKDRKEL